MSDSEAVAAAPDVSPENAIGTRLFTQDKDAINAIAEMLGVSFTLTTLALVCKDAADFVTKHFHVGHFQGCAYSTTDQTILGMVNFMDKSRNQLQSLNLDACIRMTSASYSYLPQLKGLKSLSLSYAGVTNASMPYLSEITSLTYLDLSFNAVLTDAAMPYLEALTELEHLDLKMCTQITTHGVQHVAKLSKLRYLGLAYCGLVSDEAIEAICDLPELRSLSLCRCKLLSEDVYTKLLQIETLRTLDLRGCDVKEEVLEQLAAANIDVLVSEKKPNGKGR